jgi:TM2 domain-containing membrane protein YozV
MAGGIFGLHHFYLGDRRRGFKYLAFFWTSVPMFAGWYDAVKLAWLDAAQFDANYPRRLLDAADGALAPGATAARTGRL